VDFFKDSLELLDILLNLLTLDFALKTSLTSSTSRSIFFRGAIFTLQAVVEADTEPVEVLETTA
jgi:hypothetical protein